MIKRGITLDYVSEIDRFLEEFDKTNPPSEAQIAEKKKYQRIYALRDNKVQEEEMTEI